MDKLDIYSGYLPPCLQSQLSLPRLYIDSTALVMPSLLDDQREQAKQDQAYFLYESLYFLIRPVIVNHTVGSFWHITSILLFTPIVGCCVRGLLFSDDNYEHTEGHTAGATTAN